MKSEVKRYLSNIVEVLEPRLEALLPDETETPASIHKLMRYSLLEGGKRVRPALIMASWEICGGAFGDDRPVLAGAAFEMLHTFSLIHDDLPCMDDDDYRRGKLSAHKAFNEALAVLGGDALCIYAFECLANLGNLEIIKEISRALGTGGMIGGQVVDIESEGKRVDRSIIEYIHTNKTAALIRASVRTGAMLADANEITLQHLTKYGKCIGLAFQVVDDILDEEGTTEQLGKDAGSDRAQGKATYPSICGMVESKQYATRLVDCATDALKPFGEKATVLRSLAEFVRNRVS
ncbi:MAG: polyprenyl synthetase family protein [Chitinivibrionales bacterium]|nr:polyprenyl synthetase family protein [Chitinivibrionales bacterium]